MSRSVTPLHALVLAVNVASSVDQRLDSHRIATASLLRFHAKTFVPMTQYQSSMLVYVAASSKMNVNMTRALLEPLDTGVLKKTSRASAIPRRPRHDDVTAL
jgi:hypothetical protein